jgi:glycosyltransferase involved in cell wall biosynthesis
VRKSIQWTRADPVDFMTNAAQQFRTVVLIPCHNEEATIAKVIADCRAALPAADIHVFDNNSSDGTAASALSAGAFVQQVRLQGKGNVLRRMFADIEADHYLLIDGDDTYDAESAPKLIDALREGSLDMVVGVRSAVGSSAYRTGHAFGNRLLTGVLSRLFGRTCTDILSGYRAFSHRFVKSFPVFSSGFEIETELTVHALEMSMPVGEVTTPYKERPAGSISKLRTYSDGSRILFTILHLFSIERPMLFYGGIGDSCGANPANLHRDRPCAAVSDGDPGDWNDAVGRAVVLRRLDSCERDARPP